MIKTVAKDIKESTGFFVVTSQIEKDIGKRLGEYIGIKAEMLPCVRIVSFDTGDL